MKWYGVVVNEMEYGGKIKLRGVERNKMACSGALGNEKERCCEKCRKVEGSERQWSAVECRVMGCSVVKENAMDWSGGKLIRKV